MPKAFSPLSVPPVSSGAALRPDSAVAVATMPLRRLKTYLCQSSRPRRSHGRVCRAHDGERGGNNSLSSPQTGSPQAVLLGHPYRNLSRRSRTWQPWIGEWRSARCVCVRKRIFPVSPCPPSPFAALASPFERAQSSYRQREDNTRGVGHRASRICPTLADARRPRAHLRVTTHEREKVIVVPDVPAHERGLRDGLHRRRNRRVVQPRSRWRAPSRVSARFGRLSLLTHT